MLKAVSSITNAIGALNYKGTWNASTNTPALASSVGTKGDYYVVSVAGSTTLDGISNWGVGDWAAYNGSVWQRVEGGADGNFVNLSVSSTSTLSGLTASTALALDASKNVVSVTNTGTGSNVLATSPTLATPSLGAATATSINALTITSSTGTLTIAAAKTLTASNTLTLAGTDATVMTFPATSATVARTDAGQTFTGVQTMTSPAITTPAITGIATGTGVATAATANTLVMRGATGQITGAAFITLSNQTGSVAAGGTKAIFKTGGYTTYFTGVMTVAAINGSPRVQTYVVGLVGHGTTSGTLTPLSTDQYNGASAVFTVSESTSGGVNTLTITNTSAVTVDNYDCILTVLSGTAYTA